MSLAWGDDRRYLDCYSDLEIKKSCFHLSTQLHFAGAHFWVFSAGLHHPLGNGFQRQTFPLLWITELSTCLCYRNPPLTRHLLVFTSKLTTAAQCPVHNISTSPPPPQIMALTAPLLLHHKTIARIAQRTPLLKFIPFFRTWQLLRLFSHWFCL
jgi:hypothetical protein